MERIVDEVLWLARNGEDIGATDPVDLVSICESAWSTVVDDSTAATLLLSDDAPEGLGTVEADDDQLRHLLENLLSNAIDLADPTLRFVSNEPNGDS